MDVSNLAVIYARYSSHAQNDQSIEEQLDVARRHAEARGYRVIHEYCDRAISGRTDDRPAFQQMMKDVEKHQFGIIITWKVDRIGRNREEIVFNKYKIKKHGARLEYVAEALPEGPEAVILESVLEGMAEYYSLSLAQNVKRGMKKSAEKGKVLGPSIPLGYRKGADGCHEIDPATAPVVQEIFERYVCGEMSSSIYNDLNARGFRTSKGGLFNKNSLRRILQNEIYIGTYHWGNISIENRVPAIIDKAVFTKAGEMVQANHKRPAAARATDYLLTGRVFCGTCKSQMIGESGTGRHGTVYYYYKCVKAKAHECDRKAIKKDLLEGIVINTVMQILKDDALLGAIADRAYEIYLKDQHANDNTVALESQLKDIEKSIGNLVKAIEAGLFNPAIQSRMEALQTQKEQLTETIAAERNLSSVPLTRDSILFFLTQYRSADLDDEAMRRNIIRTFVRAVYVFDDKIRVLFNYKNGEADVDISSASDDSGLGSSEPLNGAYPNPAQIRIFAGFFVVDAEIPEKI